MNLSHTQKLYNILRDGKRHGIRSLEKRVYAGSDAVYDLPARRISLVNKGYVVESDLVYFDPESQRYHFRNRGRKRGKTFWYQMRPEETVTFKKMLIHNEE